MSEQREQGESRQAGDDWPAWVKTRAFVVVAGVAALLVVAAGAFYFVSKQVEHNKAAQKSSRRLALTPPPKWVRVRPTPKGSVVAYMASATDSGPTGKLTPYLAEEDYELSAAGKSATFQKLEADFESQLEHDYSGYTELASSSATIEKKPALLLTFSYAQNQTPVTSQSLFLVKNGRLYDVHGQTLSSTWPQHAQAIKHSLLSFQP